MNCFITFKYSNSNGCGCYLPDAERIAVSVLSASFSGYEGKYHTSKQPVLNSVPMILENVVHKPAKFFLVALPASIYGQVLADSESMLTQGLGLASDLIVERSNLLDVDFRVKGPLLGQLVRAVQQGQLAHRLGDL